MRVFKLVIFHQNVQKNLFRIARRIQKKIPELNTVSRSSGHRNYLLTAAGLFMPSAQGNVIRGTKFSDGKLHVLEDPAGIILLGNYTLLVRNTIFCGVYEIMRVTDDLDD